MNYKILHDEIVNDPLARGYAAMTDAEIADDLNTAYREVNRDIVTASEIYNAIDSTEWAALAAGEQAEIWNIIHMGEVNPFGLEATRFVAIFGGQSATITALAALRKASVSRAQELNLGTVRGTDITEARRLYG